MAYDLGAASPAFPGLSPEQAQREYERMQRRTLQLEEQVRALLVLQGIANSVNAELDLAPLLRRIGMAAVQLTAAEASALYLLEPANGALVVEALETAQSAADSGAFSALDLLRLPQWSHLAEELPHSGRPALAPREGVAGWVAVHNEFVLLASTAADPRFTPDALAHESHVLGMHPAALLAVPLVYKGAVTGVLEVAQGPGRSGFDARSLDFLRTLAAQAAGAVANARLYRRLREERDRIIQAQEDERKRIARELHDGPAQSLAQMAMALEVAEGMARDEPDELPAELRGIRETALRTTHELRNLLFDLRPLVLESDGGGLRSALETFVERFHGGQGLQVRLDCHYPRRLPHAIEVTVFAIIQEAVNNVLKHATAHTCAIELREGATRLVAIVRDDGAGFDSQAVQRDYAQRGSWGLLSMLERATLIDAKLTISAQPGRGTVVALDVPLPPDAADQPAP